MARGRVKGNFIIEMDDIVGKKFGKLAVIDHDKSWYDTTLGGERARHAYLCRCECGRSVVVRRQCLLNGYTKSCGCIKKGRAKK